MNINYKDSQIELFSESGTASNSLPRSRVMTAQMTLSTENLVICIIAIIMLTLFAFTLGVERGKRVALGPDIQKQEVGAVFVAPVAVKSSSQIKAPAENPAPVVKEPQNTDDSGTLTVAATSTIKGGYTIQLASYKSQKAAQVEADRLKQKGFNDVFVLTKGKYVVLCVGNFQAKAEASLLGKKLKGRFQDLYVRSL